MEDSEERPSKIRKLESSDSISSADNEVTFSVEAARPTSVAEENAPQAQKEEDGAPSNLQNSEPASKPLSKSQLKKIRKQQEWEDGKEWRKAKRREKDKEKKVRKAEANATKVAETKEPLPRRQYKRPIQVPITFIVDCDFDELMSDKERISLGAQLTRCYSDNKTAPFRSHLVVSSFGGHLKERYETVLSNNHLGWKGVVFTEKNFVDAAKDAHLFMLSDEDGRVVGALAGPAEADVHPNSGEVNPESEKVLDPQAPVELSLQENQVPNSQDKAPISVHVLDSKADSFPKPSADDQPSIIYLSSDSPNTLEVLSPYTTYIIGGIVDKNRHKGLCYKRAEEAGIPTAKLPIGEYMTMQSRVVLATNHVLEIMVRWLEDGDWGKSFLRVIPKRKEAKLKVTTGDATQVSEVGVGVEEEAEEVGEEHEGQQESNETLPLPEEQVVLVPAVPKGETQNDTMAE